MTLRQIYCYILLPLHGSSVCSDSFLCSVRQKILTGSPLTFVLANASLHPSDLIKGSHLVPFVMFVSVTNLYVQCCVTDTVKDSVQ